MRKASDMLRAAVQGLEENLKVAQHRIKPGKVGIKKNPKEFQEAIEV